MLIGAVRNLAVLAAVLRPVKFALKDYISPAFAHPDPRPRVKFTPILVRLTAKRRMDLPILWNPQDN